MEWKKKQHQRKQNVDAIDSASDGSTSVLSDNSDSESDEDVVPTELPPYKGPVVAEGAKRRTVETDVSGNEAAIAYLQGKQIKKYYFIFNYSSILIINIILIQF